MERIKLDQKRREDLEFNVRESEKIIEDLNLQAVVV